MFIMKEMSMENRMNSINREQYLSKQDRQKRKTASKT